MSDYQIRYQIIFFSVFFTCLIGVIFYVLNDKFNAAVSRIISPYKLRVLGFAVICGYTVIAQIGTYQDAERHHAHIHNWHFHLAQIALFYFILGYPWLIINSGIKKQFAMVYKITCVALSLSLTLYEAIIKNIDNVVVALGLLVMASSYLFFFKEKPTILTPEEEKILQEMKR